MTKDSKYLDAVLKPRHSTPVEDPTEIAQFDADQLNEEWRESPGYTSKKGAVMAQRSFSTGENYIFACGIGKRSSGEATTYYKFDTEDEATQLDEVGRLFIAQSLRLGTVQAFTGWRERIVVMIHEHGMTSRDEPEFVLAKESNIFRTLADGSIESATTFNVLDAYQLFNRWVNDLAMELGATGELFDKDLGQEWGDDASLDIAQAWLMREAAESALSQARTALNLSLAAQSRMLRRSPEANNQGLSLAEIARSLHTDRPNLTRLIRSAESDPGISKMLNALEVKN